MAGRDGGEVSIVEVATLAHVSTATVSRVLSGRRTKDDDIARRVREAATTLNYSVNRAASALRTDVTRTLGLVIPSATDGFSARLLDVIEQVTVNEGQQLLLGIGGDQDSQVQRIRALAGRRVDGLMVVPSPGADLGEAIEPLTDTMPVVQIGGRQRTLRSSMVTVDENSAMALIMDHLAQLGVRSAAYLAGEKVSFESAELFAMFHTQLRLHQLTTDMDWNQFGPATVQRGFQCAMRICGGAAEGQPHPDALVCADDMVAFGALAALQTLGLQVPGTVKVVGFNDSAITKATMPTLTSVHPPFGRIVGEAQRLISFGAGHPARISLPPELVVRGSTVEGR